MFDISRRGLLMAGGLSVGFGLRLSFAKPRLDLAISNRTLDAAAKPGDAVGTLSVVKSGGGTWTFSLVDDAGGRFALSGNTITVGAVAPDYAAAPAPEITVRATDGSHAVERSFVMEVRQPLPQDAQALTFISNRVSFPVVSQVAASSDASGLCHSFHVSPDYAVTGGIRLLFCNFYLDTGGVVNPEKKPGNPKTVDFATIFVGDTAYPVTFGGRQSATIPDGGFVWSDVVMDGGAELELAARTTYYVRVSETVAEGGRRTFNPGSQMQTSRFSNWTLGDGVEYTSAPQTDKRLSGAVEAYSGGTVMIAPAMIVGKGWDGSPVYAIMGDSIGMAQSDYGTSLAERGVVGHIGRALDDMASGRRSFANLAVPGTKPQDQSEDAAGQWQLRLDAIKALPNQPFNRVISRMGQNGIFEPYVSKFAEFGRSQPGNLENAMHKWWVFLRRQFGADIIQLLTTPRARNADNSNTFWTDPAREVPTDPTVDRFPDGTRYRFNNWLRAGHSLPDWVKVVDDDVWRDEKYPSVFGPVPGNWTLDADIASGAGMTTPLTFAGPMVPIQGDWYVIEPGVAGKAELRQSYRVEGTGPWEVYFTGNTEQAHAAGAAIKPASTGDGLHPGKSLHVLAAAALIAAKGTLLQ